MNFSNYEFVHYLDYCDDIMNVYIHHAAAHGVAKSQTWLNH